MESLKMNFHWIRNSVIMKPHIKQLKKLSGRTTNEDHMRAVITSRPLKHTCKVVNLKEDGRPISKIKALMSNTVPFQIRDVDLWKTLSSFPQTHILTITGFK